MKTLLFILLSLALVCPAQALEPARPRLTIQQNGQAFVEQDLTLALPGPRGSSSIEGLAPSMDPHTLAVRPRDGQQGLKVLGLIHEPALSGPGALLRAHVGQTLTILIPDPATRDGKLRKQARLLSVDEAPLFLVDGQIYAGPVEAVFYPPQALGPCPRVTLAYVNSGPTTRKIAVQYVAGEFNWRMDYELTADTGFRKARLDGWATISNRSGMTFRDAAVELLAGDFRQAGGSPKFLRTLAAAPMAAQMEDSLGASPEPLFEHHLYTLPGSHTLPDQGLVRLPLAQAPGVSVTKRLVASASAVPSGRTAEPVQQSVQSLISFRNIGPEGLGQPLPKGVIRVYQQEGSGSARRLIGEANLERIPAGANASFSLGQAFDIGLERTAKVYERTGKNSFKGAWDIAIRNSKPEKIILVVQESFPGKWKITESSHKLSRSTARAAEFEIEVPPTGEGRPFLFSYSFTLDM